MNHVFKFHYTTVLVSNRLLYISLSAHWLLGMLEYVYRYSSIKEVDEIIETRPLSEEGTARLKVIYKQLEGKATLLSEFDQEISSLCDVEEIEHEVKEAKLMTTKIIGCKHKIEDTLKSNTSYHNW